MGSPWWLHHASPLLVLWEDPSSDSVKTSEARSVRQRRGGESRAVQTLWESVLVINCQEFASSIPSLLSQVLGLSTLYCPDTRAHME